MPHTTCCDDCWTELAYTRLLKEEVIHEIGRYNAILCLGCIEVHLRRPIREDDHLHPRETK